ncbi:MAG: glycosyltransferase family 2 protein [Hymenobacter sp.]|nr:MAG: glycosyltransferase family 2 protein [Hymenobacter sp.]
MYRGELSLLQQLATEGYTIINQANAGPGAARNTGVKAAHGEYILFLDSDNKIRPAYIDRAIAVLSKRPEVGVVHGNANFFGIENRVQFVPQEFDMLKILRANYIDMCSAVRKSAWLAAGGFDESRIMIGHEDWEFWINVGSRGWEFAHIQEVLFDYRIREDSLTQQVSQSERLLKMVSHVHTKHWRLYASYYHYLEQQLDYYAFDQRNPVRSFLKFMYRKYFPTGAKAQAGHFVWQTNN